MDEQQKLLRQAADLQLDVNLLHHSVSGITDEGLFGGSNKKLNMDKHGNVILTRVAKDETQLSKNWVNTTLEELEKTSLFHGGGNGLPTSGFSDWADSFGVGQGDDRLISRFTIPKNDFLKGIKEGNVYLGNIGEGEFVLNPKWSKDYLTHVNNRSASVADDNSIVSKGIKSIDRSSDINLNLDTPNTQGYSETSEKLLRLLNVVPEKNNDNSFKSFFKNSTLKSFDTETTGLDTENPDFRKRSKIWQLGLATEGIDGVEAHVNPFFIQNEKGELNQAPKMRESFVKDAMKTSVGEFSKKAYEQGNFNSFFQMYESDTLKSLNQGITDTIGSIKTSDVVILQNMNFENRILKSSLEQGLIDPKLYTSIADRMNTVELDLVTSEVRSLFQRPPEVQRKMREADMLFHTQYLPNKDEHTFQQYKNTVNEAVNEYVKIINNPDRVGAVAVELQDVTKAFLANAADRGFIPKQTAILGLNMDFLTKTILNDTEKHTALSDSKQTISLFEKMMSMNTELKENKVSNETIDILKNIKKHQPEEANKRFITAVKSTISDFNLKGSSKISDSLSWYNPEVKLRQKTATGFESVLLPRLETTKKEKTTSLSKALGNTLDRYSMYNEDLLGFNRKDYINKVLDDYSNGATFSQLQSRVEKDSFEYAKIPKSASGEENIIASSIRQSVLERESYWKEPTTLFGKHVTRKTKATVLGGIGAGLAYMAFQGKPAPNEKDYSNVSQQFYDDQYLGTAFVDFKERNKHYMM